MKTSLHEIGRFEDRPEAARAYVARLEDLLGVPIALVNVGPDRRQTLIRETEI